MATLKSEMGILNAISSDNDQSSIPEYVAGVSVLYHWRENAASA